MCLRRRASAHHVRARTPRFASGGDDYFLILLVESCKVRAIASPAAALTALAAAIVVLCTRCALLGARSHVPFGLRPMALTGCGSWLHARGYRQPGGRLASGKFESGLLPQFEHQLRVLLFCVVGCVRTATAERCRAVQCTVVIVSSHTTLICTCQHGLD